MKPRIRSRAALAAFTMVEMMVAVAVLVVLVVMLVALMSGSSRTINLHESRTDIEGEVRTIFDAMGNDFAHALKTGNADAIFNKKSGNDSMFFYSNAPGQFDAGVAEARKSPLSVVGYCIDGTAWQLNRLAKGLTWDDSGGPGPAFLTYPSATSTTPNPESTLVGRWAPEIKQPAQDTTHYHVIGKDVFRMELCFLRTDGTLSDNPVLAVDTAVPPSVFRDVSAIVVALAVLAPEDRALLTLREANYAALASLAGSGAFADYGGDSQLMAAAWMGKLNRPASLPSAIPRQVASRIRVYQQFFYLR